MSERNDKLTLTLEQFRGDESIFDLQANWKHMEDWEANKVLRDIVVTITEKSADWDKALTGGPPTA